jgi:hypothetical protein
MTPIPVPEPDDLSMRIVLTEPSAESSVASALPCACPAAPAEDQRYGIHIEYDPACPVHSEHLFDPRTQTWILRAPDPEKLLPGDQLRRFTLLGDYLEDGAAPETFTGVIRPSVWNDGIRVDVRPLHAQGRITLDTRAWKVEQP